MSKKTKRFIITTISSLVIAFLVGKNLGMYESSKQIQSEISEFIICSPELNYYNNDDKETLCKMIIKDYSFFNITIWSKEGLINKNQTELFNKILTSNALVKVKETLKKQESAKTFDTRLERALDVIQ
jgi:hypothetical protein